MSIPRPPFVGWLARNEARHAEYIRMQEEHLKRYNPAQQSDINLVRMWLQVSTLADMTDLSRGPKYINLDYLDGKHPSSFSSDNTWPRQ